MRAALTGRVSVSVDRLATAVVDAGIKAVRESRGVSSTLGVVLVTRRVVLGFFDTFLCGKAELADEKVHNRAQIPTNLTGCQGRRSVWGQITELVVSASTILRC